MDLDVQLFIRTVRGQRADFPTKNKADARGTYHQRLIPRFKLLSLIYPNYE
jgi:hypothetical protein